HAAGGFVGRGRHAGVAGARVPEGEKCGAQGTRGSEEGIDGEEIITSPCYCKPASDSSRTFGARDRGGRASLDWTAEGGCPHMILSSQNLIECAGSSFP